MSYAKTSRRPRRRRRRPGIGDDNADNGGAKVPLGAAMAALLITALVIGRKMR